MDGCGGGVSDVSSSLGAVGVVANSGVRRYWRGELKYTYDTTVE